MLLELVVIEIHVAIPVVKYMQAWSCTQLSDCGFILGQAVTSLFRELGEFFCLKINKLTNFVEQINSE